MASRRAVLKILERRHSDDMFCDFVHPEAALMGLLNYYSAVEPDQDVELWDAQIMQQVVQPVRSFHLCTPKLTFRGGGEIREGCDCCYPEVLLVLSLARSKIGIAIHSSWNAWRHVSVGPPESRCQQIGAGETRGGAVESAT